MILAATVGLVGIPFLFVGYVIGHWYGRRELWHQVRDMQAEVALLSIRLHVRLHELAHRGRRRIA